ncbi:PcfJ domain-containing protein [Hungatella hathewayi]|uniref:PcfJ domain-containing protein n=1 Tax=Hungatella hathewayi TaxID=154046 RepID=UPI0035623002
MKEIINLTSVYLIFAINDEYLDSNGCHYKKLTSPQKKVLNKKYVFDMQNEKDTIVLKAYQIFIDEDESSITLKKAEVMNYRYEKKSMQDVEHKEDIIRVYKNSLNPEVFISFVTLIMADKPCYEIFMEWTAFTVSDVHEGIKEELYILLLNLIEKNQDGIISELLLKNMMAILYDFLYFNKKNGTLHLNEYHILLKVAQNFENLTLRNMKVNYVQGEVCEAIYRLIVAYGNENTHIISKFIKTMIKMGEKSRRDTNYYKSILEILRELSTLKNQMPELNLYTNINYILKSMFKQYEDKPDPEGFLNLLKMWLDYLTMKENDEPVYPSVLKEAHDDAIEKYNRRNDDLSLETYHDFKDAVKGYKDLEYENRKYKIRIPNDPHEMKEVGKNLHICVGYYVLSVARKNSKILWLCNKEDIPFVALEVRDNQLIQAKAECNHHPGYEINEFIQLWCRKKGLIITSY